jgi:xanthine dehydrogenase accessory factor
VTGRASAPLGPAEAASRVLSAIETGRRAVVVLHPLEGANARPGRRVIVEAGSTLRREGSLGAADVDARADELARALLSGDLDEGMHDGLYAEVHLPRPGLVIVGAGHIARPLCSVGALLGFDVVVMDDRPDFATRERFPEAERVVRVDFTAPFAHVPLTVLSHVVMVTRGHRFDYECLRRLLATEVRPRYLGMIGSQRRVRATFAALEREGVPAALLAEVRAPIGLDLGAETPAEIAIAVGAELVLAWRGGSGQPLCEVARVAERHFPSDEGHTA